MFRGNFPADFGESAAGASGPATLPFQAIPAETALREGFEKNSPPAEEPPDGTNVE